VVAPANLPLALRGEWDLAFSPDGAGIAYVAGEDEHLVIRSLDRLETQELPGTRGARAPFLSPDGKTNF
jgi:hypothetical protein